MSSRRPKQRRGESSSHSTPWSEWVWNDNYNCYSRYRPSNGPAAVDGYEWGYKKNDTAPRTTTTDYSSQSNDPQLPEATGEEEGEYTIKSSPPLANQYETPLYQATRAPSSGIDGLTRGMGALSTGGGYSSPHIRGDRRQTHERFDKSYKIHKEYEFKQFRVFKVIWSEPKGGNDEGSQGSQGSHDTISVRDTRNGPPTHEKVRRFVIISPMKGHCLCLPINTYLKQGVLKSGVHAMHHTIIYTTRKPEYMDGEWEKGMSRTPIKVDPATPRDKLEPQSRLNYAKVYTVEYNVKVCFIGKVHVDYRSQVVFDYNAQHPQLSYAGNTQAPEFSQQDVRQAGGWMDTYGAAGGDGGYPANPVDDEEDNPYPLSTPDLPTTQEYPDRHTDVIPEEDTAPPAFSVPSEAGFAGEEFHDVGYPVTDSSHQQPQEGEPERYS